MAVIGVDEQACGPWEPLVGSLCNAIDKVDHVTESGRRVLGSLDLDVH